MLYSSYFQKHDRSGKHWSSRCLFVCLFVCFGVVTVFVPLGQLPREDLRRSPLPPRPLVNPGPHLSSYSLSPHTFVMHPVSGPCNPPLSCTYNLSSIWSVPSLFSCPTHIFETHKKEPLNKHQNPHTNCVNLSFQWKQNNLQAMLKDDTDPDNTAQRDILALIR